jgi:hypothetical protein
VLRRLEPPAGYYLFFSVSTQAAPAAVSRELISPPMDLAARVHQAIEAL